MKRVILLLMLMPFLCVGCVSTGTVYYEPVPVLVTRPPVVIVHPFYHHPHFHRGWHH